MFTDFEVQFIKESLGRDKGEFQPSLSYSYKKQEEYKRDQNKYRVRKQLDKLRKEYPSISPLEAINLRSIMVQKELGLKNFSGIYIIQNHQKKKFYIGKSKNVFNRVHQHFVNANGNHEVYLDYITGDKISVSFIHVEDTDFNTINELEDNAIRAYNSMHPHGYNKIGGNILDRSFFLSESQLEVAQLIIKKIRFTKEFKGLTNNKKRLAFIGELLRKYDFPNDSSFKLNFMRYIKEIQNESRDLSN